MDQKLCRIKSVRFEKLYKAFTLLQILFFGVCQKDSNFV